MKWIRVIVAVMALGAASCSSPTAPRLPQPEEGRDPPPDQPGVVAFQAVQPGAGQVAPA